MQLLKFAGLVCLACLAASPTFAKEKKAAMAKSDTMSMMKGGEVVAIMPDGHMGTMMMSDKKMMEDMMKMAKPLDHCVMMMTGADGKTYMVDTSSSDAMKECEKMAM
jgi:hypothetical protein